MLLVDVCFLPRVSAASAPLSPPASEIEFGRARPTSLLHSAVRSLTPRGARELQETWGRERKREGDGGVTNVEEEAMERAGEGEMLAI